MDPTLLAFFLGLLALVVLDVLALRYGADSRGHPLRTRRNWW